MQLCDTCQHPIKLGTANADGTAHAHCPDRPKDAIYICRRCSTRIQTYPGPLICPHCGHDYMDWVNYDQWAAVHGR